MRVESAGQRRERTCEYEATITRDLKYRSFWNPGAWNFVLKTPQGTYRYSQATYKSCLRNCKRIVKKLKKLESLKTVVCLDE